jgi:hypothetical protein
MSDLIYYLCFFRITSPYVEDTDEFYNGTVLPIAGSIGNDCGLALTDGLVETNVIRGQAKQGAYPFIAAIGQNQTKFPEKTVYGCVGSLINRRYVLTAANCHTKNNPIIEVLLGEYDFTRDPDCDEEGCQSSEL